VAGPGAGKTHTFRELLKRVEGPKLALTFLLVLVRDLQKSLEGIADVRSFHGLAKQLLHSRGADGVTKAFDYYPAIDTIYESDLLLTLEEQSGHDVADILMNLREDDQALAAILRSGTYYDAVGHTDSVYRVLRYLQANPAAVPCYAQVVVDEYQDFSRLEASLIEVLASQSPTLIVGDDDQALYLFKHASANFIRSLASDGGYAPFPLPYCSRCTAVLVEATHRVVTAAQASQAGCMESQALLGRMATVPALDWRLLPSR
jgi:superfamily I DNA/RNA helicase